MIVFEVKTYLHFTLLTSFLCYTSCKKNPLWQKPTKGFNQTSLSNVINSNHSFSVICALLITQICSNHYNHCTNFKYFICQSWAYIQQVLASLDKGIYLSKYTGLVKNPTFFGKLMMHHTYLRDENKQNWRLKLYRRKQKLLIKIFLCIDLCMRWSSGTVNTLKLKLKPV